MISNTDYLIVFHKIIENHNNIWTKHIYKKVWCFENRNSKIQDGYENSNKLQIRIPYITNSGLNIRHFDIGDIIIKLKPTLTVEQVNALTVKEMNKMEVYNLSDGANLLEHINIEDNEFKNAYDIYYITSISNNVFGNQKHIHLEAK